MDLYIEHLLKERNIKIEYADVDFDARLFDTPKGPVIIINQDLVEGFANWAVMHEIGHDKFDNYVTGSYRDSDATHWKMEYKANKYMLGEMFRNYISSGDVEVRDINPVEFLEQHGLNLNLEPLLRKIIKKWASKNQGKLV